MFEQIKNDSYIQQCFIDADDPNSLDGLWVYHGIDHVNDVVDMVEKVLIQLNYYSEYIENAKIAALLHDMGYGGVKKDHEIRSYELAKKYIEKNNIKLKYKDEILDAIKHHREGFNSENVMALALILADKMDIRKERLAPEGYKIEGLNQYQYINDINIIKKDNNFTVQFIIDNKCDKDKLKEWYFTDKVLNAIKSFANHFNFNLKILWNDEEWK